MKVEERVGQLMMIDDDEIVLKINSGIIEKTALVKQTLSFHSTGKALDYLMTAKQWPEIVLCNIHMPVVDGWKFIDQYNHLISRLGVQSMLCIHSDISSDYELDELERRKSIDLFITKPLNLEKAHLVLDYFYNKFSRVEHRHGAIKFVTS